MRIIVCGSRRWTDRRAIEHKLYDLAIEHGTDLTIVHGGAKGADRIAHQEALKAGLRVEVHEPDYARYSSKFAPLARNIDMANTGADLCVAFWDGRSAGTQHMVAECANRDIPVEIVEAL